MNFLALDLEWANNDCGTICQIGLAVFREGKLAGVWSQYINPEAEFGPMQVRVHGIRAEDVATAPTFGEFYAELTARLAGLHIVSHSNVDRAALARACARYGVPLPDAKWVNSLAVARRVWPSNPDGHGLRQLAGLHEIGFEHHNAGEDARVCGEIFVKALQQAAMPLDELLQPKPRQSHQRDTRAYRDSLRRAGFTGGALSDETIAFTGNFAVTKAALGELVERYGAAVLPKMTRKATILVVGKQRPAALRGRDKSTSHEKAEKLLARGTEIKIMDEESLRALIASLEGIQNTQDYTSQEAE